MSIGYGWNREEMENQAVGVIEGVLRLPPGPRDAVLAQLDDSVRRR